MGRRIWFLAAEVSLCLLLLLIWPRLGLDDSYIFLTYARNLAHSGLFAFNPGEVSYGFSSPAYVLLLAGVSRLTGIAVGVALSNILGVLLCALSACAVWSIWQDVDEQPLEQRPIVFLSLLLSGPLTFTVWFVFGMETGLAVVATLGLLLWLVKLRAGAPRFPWLLVGLVSAAVLATTRLESALYIAVILAAALSAAKTSRQRFDLVWIALFSAAMEAGWLIYARHRFGSYLPWTSAARLLYYLPGEFGLTSPAQFYSLGALGRTVIALKALVRMSVGGPVRFLCVALPLLVAGWLLWSQQEGAEAKKPAPLKAALIAATAGMLLEMVLFAYLFPLAHNRHLAPYSAGLWALISLPLAQRIVRRGAVVRYAAFAFVILLWIGGAIEFRSSGLKLEPLHRLAQSGGLTSADRLAAEPIGIVAFEGPSRIIDLGGLTDRSAWPLLMKHPSHDEVTTWELQHGATKMLFSGDECLEHPKQFGGYCLVDASSLSPAQAKAPSR